MHAVQCPEAYRVRGEKWRQRLSCIAEEDFACLESELEFADLLQERKVAITRCPDRFLWAGVLDGNPELAQFWLESGALFRPEFGVLHDALLLEAELDCVGQPVGRHGLVGRMERAVRQYRGMAQELARKRPDGLVVNWQKWEVFLLEFTRAWDARPDYRLEVKARKTAQYVPLLDRVLARLGAAWKGQTSRRG